MKISKHKKKGMTLIEAIISVALLSILIVPISAIVINSVNTSKRAEIKQEATFIGQKLLEEIKAYEEINLKGTDKFQLLDGEFIKKETNQAKGYDYYGKFKREDLDIEINLVKNNKFNYDISDKSNYTFRLNNEKVTNKLNNTYNLDISKELNLAINGDVASISNKDSAEPSLDQSIYNNKIIINLDKEFSENIKLNIHNNSASEISVYIKKYRDSIGNLEFNNISGVGEVKEFINNLNESEEGYLDTVLGDLYEINVSVSKNGEDKFSGQSTANIIFK